MGSWELEQDPQTRIVWVDDDNEYSDSMLRVLLDASLAMPDCALGFHGVYPRLDGQLCVYWGVTNALRVPMLEGCAGVIVRRGSLGPDRSPRKMLSRFSSADCRLGDDLMISMHLAARGVERRMLDLPHAHRKRQTGSTEGRVVVRGYEDGTALHFMERGQGNRQHYSRCLVQNAAFADQLRAGAWPAPLADIDTEEGQPAGSSWAQCVK